MMLEQEWCILEDSLQFFHVEELKKILSHLSLPSTGKKSFLIAQLLYLLKKGEIKQEIKIPKISWAEKGGLYPLHPDTLILKGAYKNDLKTRLFFKTLIGDHFHFTAFGQDWINERWMEGRPPSYGEFAEMWKVEYERRRKFGSEPKKEWAYIRFVQNFTQNHPQASKVELVQAWEQERKKNVKLAYDIIKKLHPSPLGRIE